MDNLQIKIARDYNDAVIISKHIAEIWGGEINKRNYAKLYRLIQEFGSGFLIAFLAQQPVGTSIAFPLKKIPSFDEINTQDIYTMASADGEYYYIHLIQVLTDFRNKGFGIKLLKYQLNSAKKNKFKEIIGIGIDRELDLWRRCGFREFGEFGFYKNFGRFKWIKMEV